MSAALTTPAATAATSSPPTSLRKRRGIPGLRGTGVVGHLAALVIVAAAVVAVVGPWIAPHDPDHIDLSGAFAGSSPEHLLGLDSQGRDIVSRLLVGARAALLGPLVVVVLSVVIGAALAVLSAWRGGLVDQSVSAVLDVLFAFPGILIAVLVAAVFGPSLTTAALALSIAYTPYIARVIRGAAVKERGLPYIASLEVQGQPSLRICLRHLVPNVLPLIVAQATIVFGYAMVDLAAISFIGLGVQPPDTDWGLMVAGGQAGVLQGYVAEAFAAGLCIVIVVVAFNLLGERLVEEAPEHR
jgi:peptide/nickel transport system permease protein